MLHTGAEVVSGRIHIAVVIITVRFGLAGSARWRVPALDATGETSRTYRPRLGALDFGQEATIT